jgi:RNA polymerase sigma-70 factor (sigma-E family)
VTTEGEDFRAFAISRGTSLFRTAYLLTGGDYHLAEDLTQEALSRVYARWRKIQRMDYPEAYARTILTHLYIGHKRKKSSSEWATEHPAERAPGGAVQPGTDESLRLTLLAALAGLAPTDRAVVVLRYWEDRSVEDVARALGLSNGAVRNRSHRALSRLRDVLGEGFPNLIAA